MQLFYFVSELEPKWKSDIKIQIQDIIFKLFEKLGKDSKLIIDKLIKGLIFFLIHNI